MIYYGGDKKQKLKNAPGFFWGGGRVPTEAKTWKRVPPQGWNSDLNRQGVVAVHWMPEKFSGFPGTRVSPHLANGKPPAKEAKELRRAGRKLDNGITTKHLTLATFLLITQSA